VTIYNAQPEKIGFTVSGESVKLVEAEKGGRVIGLVLTKTRS
jgi:hypothetical protein